MPIRCTLNFRVSSIFLIVSAFLNCVAGGAESAVVTLDSVMIYKTHEWLASKPTVYFQCQGGNKTKLPDVQKEHVLYSFNGEESWQPLTEFESKKCKRCGFYEEDSIKSDDVFEEWEFCPSDFTAPAGKYVRFNEKEFNATFMCLQCTAYSNVSSSSAPTHNSEQGMHVAAIIVISALVSTVLIIGIVVGYKYWQKKRREQDQARFLKLFEDGDDIEDELGLGDVI
ncbi:uncharacterized protein LOC111013628 [Momordica charantia]|uniref:Uncharacterized protein LOC111013628 n=1 Tax=Momordica charantia TaxID=3673 RepID=A0A6J1CRX4_MOMCH|nr:uncharacterized protein LOC111013628 [Momordica charantia]